jgi:hypothetical protein
MKFLSVSDFGAETLNKSYRHLAHSWFEKIEKFIRKDIAGAFFKLNFYLIGITHFLQAPLLPRISV